MDLPRNDLARGGQHSSTVIVICLDAGKVQSLLSGMHLQLYGGIHISVKYLDVRY